MEQKKGVLKPYIMKYKIPYALGILTLLIVDCVNLLIPQFIGTITDGLETGTFGMEEVIRYMLYILSAAAVIALGRVLWRLFLFGSARKIERELRNDMFHKLEELSQKYFQEHKTGDLMAHFTNDIESLRMSIGPAVISAFDAVVMTLMVLYKMMVYVNVQLTLITLIPMACIAVGVYVSEGEMEKRFTKKQDAFAKLSDRVQESISGVRVIKSFVQEKQESAHFAQINEESKKANLHVVKLMAIFQPSLDFFVGIAYVITIIVGGYLALKQQISIGQFVAFNSYLGMLVWPMIAIGDSITMFSQGRAALNRIGDVLRSVSDIVEDENAIQDVRLSGGISIRNVQFAYEQGQPEVLKDIDLVIRPGETLGILGKTGAGKSTLVNLLLRVYDVTGGEIYLDDYPIQKLSLKTLHENIAYVPQENFLFSDTLANNIAFGKQEAEQEEIYKVCEDACIHDNILGFSEGYETVVGERGVTLSGGQKQRSSIARALLKDAPIMIFDDALSAVDTDTEEKILQNLKAGYTEKTMLMIAHRISTVQNADHILVIDDGKIAEYGTFSELLELNGIFRDMYEKQQLEKQLEME